jgi:uncharacterized protein (TIGR03435 family)
MRSRCSEQSVETDSESLYGGGSESWLANDMITMRHIVALWFVGITAVTANEQTPVAPATSTEPRFEVASVKSNRDATSSGGTRSTPGRFTATASQPLELIRYAYQIDILKIVDAPDWTRRERFDITATTPPGSLPHQNAAMLRSLLADRFALRTHREKRPMRVFVLSRVRPQGDLGPGIRPSTVDCTGRKPACGESNAPRGTYRGTGIRWPPDVLIFSELQLAVAAPVIDRTGLTGQYEIGLEWADPTATVAGQAAAAGRPSLFTALREQLGLKLEPSTELIEVLVIDSVERPKPN